jgi:hypothetical protein
MTAVEFFKTQKWIKGHKKPKKDMLFGYWDLIQFAQSYEAHCTNKLIDKFMEIMKTCDKIREINEPTKSSKSSNN